MNMISQKSLAIAVVIAFTVLGFESLYPPVTQSKSLPAMNETLWLTNRTFNYVVAHVSDDNRGRIAFVSNRGGNSDIYVMHPDGSGLVNLTNHPASDRLPAWSFDGSKLVFRSNRDGNAEIYVMDDDGSNVVRVTFDPAFDTSPSWTPEGTIVFSSNRSGRFELYEMNADGSDLGHIEVGLDGHLLFPRVSAQGHRVAFNRTNFFDTGAVWIAHRDGSQAEQLTPDNLVAAFPAWSPRGNRLAFANNVCPVCDLSDIFVMNQGGNQIRQLTESGDDANDLFPRWSPDGSQIVFDRQTGAGAMRPDIYIMNEDGSEVTNITQHPAVDVEADWGP